MSRRGRFTPISVPGADDVYSVEHLEDGRLFVQHFPDSGTRRACCRVRVTINDEDRLTPHEYEKVKGTTAALTRVYQRIEQKHAK